MVLLFAGPASMRHLIRNNIGVASIGINNVTFHRNGARIGGTISISRGSVRTFGGLGTHNVRLRIHGISASPGLGVVSLVDGVSGWHVILVVARFSRLDLAWAKRMR